MNAEHYEKVRRISVASEAVLEQSSARIGGMEGIFACGEACQKLWMQEFPRLTRLDLSDADLSGCLFAGELDVPLEGADFRNARLDHSRWFGLNLDEADFSGASLRDCIMGIVWCQETMFRGANLSGARLKSLTMLRRKWAADFSDADLSGAIIGISVFGSYGNFQGAKMTGCRVYAKPSCDGGAEDAERRLNEFLACLTPEQRAEIIIGPEPEEQGSQQDPAAGGKQCFLATAACGSPQNVDVVVLREFRDKVLWASAPGRAMVRIYETVSPPLAGIIARHSLLRLIVRRLAVVPAATLASRRLRSRA